jgi:hypothetical protein
MSCDPLMTESRVFERVRPIADAVLYEGYLLYPYRKSSAKNRVRWQFGVLAPREWVEARGRVEEGVSGSAESWWSQTECLLEAPPTAEIRLRLRFLQPTLRFVEELRADGTSIGVDELTVDGVTHLSFEAAVAREHDLVTTVADLLRGEQPLTVNLSGTATTSQLARADGRVVGLVRETTAPLLGTVTASARTAEAPFPVLVLRVRTENAVTDVPDGVSREAALSRSMVSCHVLLATSSGRFLSLQDPPAWAAELARACRNVRTFPVHVGDENSCDTLLSAPIILPDHPQVAPESPGDLFDATEIDEILSLRALTLTEAERAEVRSTDPRAAAILARVDAMPPEMMERLHGAVRSLRQLPAKDEAPRWWEPGGDDDVSPETDLALVDGVAVRKGTRVRLRPRTRGTDAHDMFLAGRIATVERVLLDVDGSTFLSVSIDDDPGAEMLQWYGRLRQFRPEEVELIAEAAQR